MIVNFSHQQMLQAWRTRAGLEPSVSDGSLERFDAVDIDSRISLMMRRWYLDLLDTGDPAMVGCASEVAPMLTLTPCVGGYAARISGNDSIRRVVSIRLSGWQRDAVLVDASPASRTVALQSNPFSRAGSTDPVAWRHPDGDLIVVPADSDSRIISAKAYLDTGADLYRLDERALTTIPRDILF